MQQWDTFQWEFPHGSHPCVVISPADRCANRDIETVNILGCSSHRARRQPLKHEVLLDAADGMDWETLVRCDVIYLARKTELRRKRGRVAEERQRELGAKLIRVFGLYR